MRLRQFLLPVIMVSLTLGVAIYGIFLAVGVAEAESEVFKSLVDANAALLGFLGIITVFALSMYRDAIKVTEKEIHDLKLAREKATRSYLNPEASHLPSYGSKIYDDKYREGEYELYKKRLHVLEEDLKEQRFVLKDSPLFTITGGIFFVVSIFLCLLAMGNLSYQVRSIITICAVTATFLGLLFMFVMIWNLRLSLE